MSDLGSSDLQLCQVAKDPGIVIVGGGLAGSTAAAALALAGWRTTIFERDTFPRDKLCGEFLSGESRRLLGQIGCLDAIMRYDPPEIRAVRFISIRQRELLVPLPTPAIGISRRVLDDVLFRHAMSSGAAGFTGSEVTSISKTGAATQLQLRTQEGAIFSMIPRIAVCAYGRRSRLDHAIDRPFLRNLDSSIGLKLHHRIAETAEGAEAHNALAHTTEIYGLNGGYCGIAMVEGGAINVCMLLSRETFRQIGTAHWSEVSRYLAQENRALGKRLAALVPIDKPPLTVSQMPFTNKEPARDDLIFIGDAAGMIAPLCGDGMAMGIQSGLLLARLIQKEYGEPASLEFSSMEDSQIASKWIALWKREFGTRIRTGRALQRIMLSPTLSEMGIAALNHAPSKVTATLARITRGQ